MRIQILSDLHADINREMEPPSLADADLVVAAGDIREGIVQAFMYLRDHIAAPTPIVFVAGNHEFYRFNHTAELRAGIEAARRFGIAFLENQTTIIGGVRFIGATLWTDYEFFGEDFRKTAMEAAEDGLADHRQIGIGREVEARFRARHARELHLASRQYLETAFSRRFDGPTVAVTHHVVHSLSVDRRYLANPLTPAFVSDLSAVIDAFQPDLWVHGHTHTSFDYRIGKTRVICNPHGYGGENPAFDPGLVVEV